MNHLTQQSPLESVKSEFVLTKMSTDYFVTLFKVLEDYGSYLLDQADNEIVSNYTKDHSIVLELYFKMETKVSKKEKSKPLADRKKNNKRITLKVHSSIIVLDAINHYWGGRELYETPALENIKNEICKQLL